MYILYVLLYHHRLGSKSARLGDCPPPLAARPKSSRVVPWHPSPLPDQVFLRPKCIPSNGTDVDNENGSGNTNACLTARTRDNNAVLGAQVQTEWCISGVFPATVLST